MNFSITAAARERPTRIALLGEGRAWTFADLAHDAQHEAADVRARGRAADRDATPASAAFDAPLAPRTIARLLALFDLGIAAVPLDARLPKDERARRIASLGATIDLDDTGVPAPRIDRDVPSLATSDDEDSRPMAIVFTSGSSGQARGAALSRRAFTAAAHASAQHLGWRDDDLWTLCLPLAHVGGLSIVTRSLRARRPVLLASHFEAALVAEESARHRATLLSLVPTMLAALLELPHEAFPWPALRAVLVGGAHPPAALLARARERRVPVLATYGMTETCSQIATERAPGTGLLPLPGVSLRIREGVIEVSAPALFTGYVHDGVIEPAALTTDGFHRTADRGAIDDEGRLVVLGRADDVIVSGGENVAPADVESVLLAIEGVREACVFGVPDERWGSLVAAALVAGPSGPLGDATLRQASRARLAPAARPRRIAWVEALAHIGPGKVDRAATAERATPYLRPLEADAVDPDDALVPVPAWTEDDRRALAAARAMLARESFAVRLARALGKPLEVGLRLLPGPVTRLVEGASNEAIERALGVALRTLSRNSGAKERARAHGFAAAATGAAGGLFGLPGLMVELPITTVLMLRSVAAIARREGFDLDDARVRLACLEVFAFGGARAGGDAAETGYYAIRAGLAGTVSEALQHIATYGLRGPAAPVLVRLVQRIASRFGIVVEEKLFLSALPIVGAAGGAWVNAVFMGHFQLKARGHFTILRLEERYGAANVRRLFDGSV